MEILGSMYVNRNIDFCTNRQIKQRGIKKNPYVNK